MESAEYYVVLHQGDWHIRYKDKHFGPLRSEREATDVARTVAERAAAQGLAATVYSQEIGGAFRQRWPVPIDAAAALRLPQRAV